MEERQLEAARTLIRQRLSTADDAYWDALVPKFAAVSQKPVSTTPVEEGNPVD